MFPTGTPLESVICTRNDCVALMAWVLSERGRGGGASSAQALLAMAIWTRNRSPCAAAGVSATPSCGLPAVWAETWPARSGLTMAPAAIVGLVAPATTWMIPWSWTRNCAFTLAGAASIATPSAYRPDAAPEDAVADWMAPTPDWPGVAASWAARLLVTSSTTTSPALMATEVLVLTYGRSRWGLRTFLKPSRVDMCVTPLCERAAWPVDHSLCGLG